MASTPLLARTGGSGLLEHLFEFVALGLEARLDRIDRRLVGLQRCAEAHRGEHLDHLALGEGIAVLELLTKGLGAVAVARKRWIPAERCVHPTAPAVRPAVIRGDEAVDEVE